MVIFCCRGMSRHAPTVIIFFVLEDISKKLGQLFFVGFNGYTLSKETIKFFQAIQPGGIVLFEHNIETKNQVRKLIKDINSLLDIKPFVAIDQEGGSVERLRKICTSLPSVWALGKVGLKEFLAAQEILVKELSELGFNMNFAPVLDINSNPKNPIIGTRSISNDPAIVSEYGRKAIELYLKFNIIPVAKHFPGHGDLNIDSHLELPVLKKSKLELEKFELIPFKQAIKANVPAVMVGHIQLPEIEDDLSKPASISKKIVQGLLRDSLHFKGLAITDELNMKGITKNYSLVDASFEAVKSGIDMLLFNWNEKQTLKAHEDLFQKKLKDKNVQIRINESYKRIMSAKKRFLYKKKNHSFSSFNHTRIANQLGEKAIHWIKRDLFFVPLNKAEPVEIIHPVTVKLREEDLIKICKELGFKKYNLTSYEINPGSSEIKNVLNKLKRKGRKVLIAYDVTIRTGQKSLINGILANYPELIVISVGLEYDIEVAPKVKYLMAAYAPNYISLLISFKKLLKNG